MRQYIAISLFTLALAMPAVAETIAEQRLKSIEEIKKARAIDNDRRTDEKDRWWDRDVNGQRPWDRDQGKPTELPKQAR